MKKLLILTCALLFGISSFAYSPRNIDEKLVHAFSVSFPKAEKVSWQEMDQAYIVSFVDNGIRSRITYQKKDGAILSYIRYYFQETLPVNIRLSIKQEFPGKKIWGVVELSTQPNADEQEPGQALKTFYYVKLESASTWTTVKLDANGESEVIERYRKAL